MHIETLWINWTFFTCIVIRGYGKYTFYQNNTLNVKIVFTFVLFQENSIFPCPGHWTLSTIIYKFSHRKQSEYDSVHSNYKHRGSVLVANITVQWPCHFMYNHSGLNLNGCRPIIIALEGKKKQIQMMHI